MQMQRQMSEVDCSWARESVGCGFGGVGRVLEMSYIVTMFWLPESNVLRGQADDVALGIDDTSSGTASSDVNADEMVQMHLDILARVAGGLAGALTRGTTERQRDHGVVQ